MAEQSVRLGQKIQTRQVLQGRLTAAKWISMTEPQVALEISDLEGDPLFSEMLHGASGSDPIIRRKRWPASSLHSGFYEMKEEAVAGGGEGDISDILAKKEDLLELIKRIGVENFERHFLYGERTTPLPDVCRELDITLQEGRRILELVLEVSARSEFYSPGLTPQTAGLRYHCIAAIERENPESDSLTFRFLSAHWSRGQYKVSYDKLEEWRQKRDLTVQQRAHLRKLLKRVELLNMRQDTLFRILARVTIEQTAYLRSRRDALRRPLSLRALARQLGIATSTVSRAISNRAVQLPWGTVVPIKDLFSGQRVVILAVLSQWESQGSLPKTLSDEQLRRRLEKEAGIQVSRRTVNECRRRLAPVPARS